MKCTIELDIECGKTTCAVKPGKFCHLLNLTMKGSGTCFLFGPVFDDNSGWIQRHKDCLKIAKRKPKPYMGHETV